MMANLRDLDWLNDLLRSSRQPQGTRSQMADRQKCVEEGHQYQVHGKIHPTKVACSRCKVSWAIGPRTEPSA